MERKPPAKAMMERFAPNTAALETPRVEGDAMGLFRSVCMTSPAAESPAPAMTAARMRGTRMFQMMRFCAAVPFPKSAERDSPTVMRDEPAKRQTKASSMTERTRTMRTSVRFFPFPVPLVAWFMIVSPS